MNEFDVDYYIIDVDMNFRIINFFY